MEVALRSDDRMAKETSRAERWFHRHNDLSALLLPLFEG
jgi:hypothetical protein